MKHKCKIYQTVFHFLFFALFCNFIWFTTKYIGLPQSKNKINSNSKARIEAKYSEGKYKLTHYIAWVGKI